MKPIGTIRELLEIAGETGEECSSLFLAREAEATGATREEVREKMARTLQVMRQSVENGLRPGTKSVSGLTGGDAWRVREAGRTGKLLMGGFMNTACARALAVAEQNAAMGRIVAAPTAGSCGILPGVLLTVGEAVGAGEKELVSALLTAAGFGRVIALNASISGAEAGCQAECGSAAAMAAAAAVELAGGTPEMSAEACALALKNFLGLVCDPVAGLVEVPCVKRNAFCAAAAIVAADMALAGVKSVIPPDEVISAMREIGLALPASLRETSEGGLAATPTGKKIAWELFGKE